MMDEISESIRNAVIRSVREDDEELLREAVRLARIFKECDSMKFAVVIIVASLAPGGGILTFGNLSTEDKLNLIRHAGKTTDAKVLTDACSEENDNKSN